MNLLLSYNPTPIISKGFALQGTLYISAPDKIPLKYTRVLE